MVSLTFKVALVIAKASKITWVIKTPLDSHYLLPAEVNVGCVTSQVIKEFFE